MPLGSLAADLAPTVGLKALAGALIAPADPDMMAGAMPPGSPTRTRTPPVARDPAVEWLESVTLWTGARITRLVVAAEEQAGPGEAAGRAHELLLLAEQHLADLWRLRDLLRAAPPGPLPDADRIDGP